MVAKKDFLPTFLLNFVVFGASPPAYERLLIAPARKGKDPAFPCKTAVPDIVDKSFDLLEFWTQHLRVTKVRIPLSRPGVNFENY
jgi:hypothetical protein